MKQSGLLFTRAAAAPRFYADMFLCRFYGDSLLGNMGRKPLQIFPEIFLQPGDIDRARIGRVRFARAARLFELAPERLRVVMQIVALQILRVELIASPGARKFFEPVADVDNPLERFGILQTLRASQIIHGIADGHLPIVVAELADEVHGRFERRLSGLAAVTDGFKKQRENRGENGGGAAQTVRAFYRSSFGRYDHREYRSPLRRAALH